MKPCARTAFLGSVFALLFRPCGRPASAQTLVFASSLTYVGAFQVGAPPGCSGNSQNGGLAYYPAHNSLFIAGACNGSKVGEVAVPGTLSSITTADYSSIPTAAWLQDPSDCTNGNAFNTGPGGAASRGALLYQGGLILYGSTLVGSTFSNYDAEPNTNEFLSLYQHGLALSDASTYSGMWGLNISATVPVTTRFGDKYLGTIPSAYQSQLGGTAFGGGGGGSIEGTLSYGPSLVAFNPASLGTANAPAPPPDKRGPATLLLGYPGITGPAGWGGFGYPQVVTQYWTRGQDQVSGAIFPDGTSSVLFFGVHYLASCVPIPGGASPTTLNGCAPPIGTASASNFRGVCYGNGTPNLSEQCDMPGGFLPTCVSNVSTCRGILQQDRTQCTGPGTPYSCCTGAGTGSCLWDACCYDPDSGPADKGYHEYPPELHVWAYDAGSPSGANTPGNSASSNISNSSAAPGTAGNNPGQNNLTAVALGKLYPNDLYPYAMWTISPPWLRIDENGPYFYSAYDPGQQLLYLAASNQRTGVYATLPVIAVFSVAMAGAQPIPPPTIVQQPQDASLSGGAGESFSFYVGATGSALKYQWQREDAGASSFSNISGATLSTYTAAASEDMDEALFRCVVSNSFSGVISSTAALHFPGVSGAMAGSDLGLDYNYNHNGMQGHFHLSLPRASLPLGSKVKIIRADQLANSAVRYKHTGMGLHIITWGLEPSVAAQMSLDTLSGVDTGKTLTLAYYDTGSGGWQAVPTTSSGGQWVATLSHFSTYALMQASPANDLSSAKVYPNPFRPSQGHTTVTFANLPASTRIRIYTLDGDKVRELSADSTGAAVWDARNDAGASVASGVYFAVVEGNGQKKIMNVAVQR